MAPAQAIAGTLGVGAAGPAGRPAARWASPAVRTDPAAPTSQTASTSTPLRQIPERSIGVAASAGYKAARFAAPTSVSRKTAPPNGPTHEPSARAGAAAQIPATSAEAANRAK